MRLRYLLFATLLVSCQAKSAQSAPWANSRLHELIDWLRQNGATGALEDLRREWRFHGGKKTLGIVTTEPLDKGSVVLSGQRNLAFEVDPTALGQSNKGWRLPSTPECKSADSRTKKYALVALEVRKGSASKYAQTFQDYPKLNEYRLSHPAFARASLRQVYNELPLIGSFRRSEANVLEVVRKCFAAWRRAPSSPVAHLTWDDMKVAYYHVRSRSFDLRNAAVSMYPFISLLNTAKASDVNVVMQADHVNFVLKTKVDVPADAELLIDYCPDCDNNGLADAWGVYLEDNPRVIHSPDPVNCFAGEDARPNATNGSMRADTLLTLDLSTAAEGLARNWTAPRCKTPEEKTESEIDQSSLHCLLARLAWESCAGEWGFADWQEHLNKKANDSLLLDSKTASRPPSLAHSEDHWNDGVAAQMTGDLKRARKSFEKAVMLDPESATTLRGLGDLLVRLGDVRAAKKKYTAAVKLDPMLVSAHRSLGTLLAQQSDFSGAEKSLEAALRIGPSDANAVYNLGTVKGNQGDKTKAEENFRSAIRLDPSLKQAHYELAVLRGQSGDAKGAIKSYRAVLKIDPHHVDAHRNLGVQLSKQGDTKGAAKKFKAAIDLDPKDAYSHFNLGLVMKDTKRSAIAIESFEAAVGLNPQLDNAHYHLGEALLDEDRFEEAVVCYRSALEINPGHKEAKGQLRMLEGDPLASVQFT